MGIIPIPTQKPIAFHLFERITRYVHAHTHARTIVPLDLVECTILYVTRYCW